MVEMSIQLSKAGHDLERHEKCDSRQVALVGVVIGLSWHLASVVCVEEHSKRKT